MSLIGKTNEEKIWNFLVSDIKNEYGAAALMGNLLAESALRPTNMEDVYQSKLKMTDESYTQAVDNGTYTNFTKDRVGYGLAQWTFETRKQNLLNYAKLKNKSIGDLEMQLEFLVYELKNSYTNTVYKVLQQAKTVLEGSNAILFNFEQPANQRLSMQRTREKYGLNFYNKYNKSGKTAKEAETMREYVKGKKTKVSQNFSSTEFDCHGKNCCKTTKLDEKLVEYLQMIREHFKKPITVTSAYRCEKHNKAIGGATKSYHAQGKAADIVVEGIASREVAKYAESIGIKGIGLYETQKDGFFTHIDTRTTKSFWYGQNEAPRSTFGGTAPKEEQKPELKPDTQTGEYHKSKNKYKIELIYLQLGDRGRDVQILQEMLKSRGYKIEASGTFDAATKTAVVDFQKKTKQNPDGIVGADTILKLLTV